MKSTQPIYLDYAAATPMSEDVIAAMQPYFRDLFYNPSSPYLSAVAVRQDYENAKTTIARTIGAKGDELVVTAGATESVNLAFHQVSGHVVTTAIEHPAVLEAAKQRPYTYVQTNAKGRVRVDDVIQAIRPDTSFVSIGFANSEIGTIQPLKQIAHAIEQIRQERREQGNNTPLLFHTDASQGFGLVDMHVARLGVDLMTLNAAKIYGPKQVGLLWIKPGTRVTPTIVGGGQEGGLRSGTENVPGVIGFAIAAEKAAKRLKKEQIRLAELRDILQKSLTEAFPDAVVHGDIKHRLPGHLSMSFPEIDAERIIFMVEEKVLVATGSACSANKHTASHVLTALEIDEKLINGSLRMTLGAETTSENIAQASEVLITALKSEYDRMAS